jgi:hypothetical protein
MNDKVSLFKYIVNNDVSKLKELLKMNKELINIKGHNLQNPIHDACFYGNKEIIDLLMSYDVTLLNSINDLGMNGYQLLTNHPKLLIYYMKMYKPINIHHINNFNHTIIVCYILNSNNLDENILKELSDIGCSLLKPDNINSINYLLEKSCNQLEIINKYFKFDLNRHGELIAYQLLDINNLDCFKKLIKLGLNVNISDNYGTMFSYALFSHNKDFINFLLSQKIDFSYTDKNEITYFHLVLLNHYKRQQTNASTLDIEIQKLILEKMTDLNKQTIDGDTIMHMIFRYNRWEDFKDILSKRKVDLTIKNKENKTPLDYIKSRKERSDIKNKFRNHIKKEDIDINLLNYKTPQHTKFIGSSLNRYISAYYLIDKYKNVGIPLCTKYDDVKNQINNSLFKDMIQNPINSLICASIFYNVDTYDFFIPLNLESGIKNIINKELIFIFIHKIFSNTQIGHANLLLIDKKNNSIERYEPYGFSIDDGKLDEILKNRIIKIMLNLTKMKYKYLAPKDYQQLYDSQSIESNFDKYQNEIGGFCQAWTFWYLEHKLLNFDIDSKTLLIKLKNKLLQENKSISDHIRSYADKLDKYMNKIYIKHKVKRNDIYRLSNTENKLYENINVDLLKIQNIE